MFLEVVTVEILLIPRRPARADDTNRIFVAFRPYDKNETARDGPDGNEAVFEIGMSLIEDLEVIDARYKEFLGFLERDTMFLLVGAVLGLVPRKPRPGMLSQWLTFVKLARSA
jgi:hypothetical protein